MAGRWKKKERKNIFQGLQVLTGSEKKTGNAYGGGYFELEEGGSGLSLVKLKLILYLLRLVLG